MRQHIAYEHVSSANAFTICICLVELFIIPSCRLNRQTLSGNILILKA